MGRIYIGDVSGPSFTPSRRHLWQDNARCLEVDPEVFFPRVGGSSADAKSICVKCDVRGTCLAYALRNDERFGIWGGLSERERRRLETLLKNNPAMTLSVGYDVIVSKRGKKGPKRSRIASQELQAL